MIEKIKKLEQDAAKDQIDRLVVGALIFYDEKIFLVRRSPSEYLPGLIEFPSGKVDKGEEILDSLIREVKEETNLEVIKIKNYIGYFDYLSSSKKKRRQLNFVVEAIGNIRLNPQEHDKYYLYSKNEVSNLNINISKATKKIIFKGFDQIKNKK